MANFLFDKGREGFLGAQIDWDGHDIAVALVDATYVPDQATDTVYTDMGAAVIKSSHQDASYIEGKTITAGVANGNPITINAVPTGETVKAVVIFSYTGNTGTSRLIAFIDQDSGGAIDLPTNDGNITVTWDIGDNKIFKL